MMHRTETQQTLAECLSDFSLRFPRSDTTNRALLAEFCRGNELTVVRWLNTETVPSGEKKWRAVTFFTLLGYHVTDFVQNRALYQQAIQIGSLDVVTYDKLATEGFGFTGLDATDSVYRRLERRLSISKNHELSLRSFVAQYTADLAAAKQLFAERYGALRVSSDLPTTPNAGEVEPDMIEAMTEHTAPLHILKLRAKSLIGPDLSHELVLETLAHMIRGLLPLAKLAASDQFSDAERKKLREMTGGDGIFKLDNALTKLCGERARRDA